MQHDPKHTKKVPGTLETMDVATECVNLGLNSVPETMLWTLHNRCSVASKPNGWFQDPKAVEIYKSIDYDYEKSFRKGDSSHAIRSSLFDEAVKDFWKESPNGTVVNFAEGLETQRYRLQDDMDENALWISIDLPDGMKAREKFIQPDEKHLHVGASVLDIDAWMPLVPKEKPVYFTAQGLFMYLEEEANKKLFQQMADKYPGATMQFDCIATWLSNQTMKGFKLTKDYTTPKMPFGVNRNNAKSLLETWVPGIEVEEIAWPTENVEGLLGWIMPIFMATPILKNYQPGFVLRVKFPSK